MITRPQHRDGQLKEQILPLSEAQAGQRPESFRYTIEGDGRWFVVESDRHDGPGLSLSIKTDGQRVTVNAEAATPAGSSGR